MKETKNKKHLANTQGAFSCKEKSNNMKILIIGIMAVGAVALASALIAFAKARHYMKGLHE